MKHFYSLYYNPSLYGHEPYLKDNKIYTFEIEKEAERALDILKFELKMSIKPVIEKRGWFKTPIKKYIAQTEQGKLISRVIETLHVRKITIHHEKDW